MALYVASNQNAGTPQALASSYKTLLGITAATGATTLRRGWMWEFTIGPSAAPNSTDCPIQWDISIQTAAGTASALTANPKDTSGGDAAALLTYLANYTAEPTVTANSSVFNEALNQRQGWRWNALDQSRCFMIPAVNAKGLACRALSPTYTGAGVWSADIAE